VPDKTITGNLTRKPTRYARRWSTHDIDRLMVRHSWRADPRTPSATVETYRQIVVEQIARWYAACANTLRALIGLHSALGGSASVALLFKAGG
jgi:hypothetical protein